VTLDLLQTPSSKHKQISLWAIWVRERGRVPAGEERLEWMLLTNWPITTFAQARRVVHWYLLRWRVEDQHKTWKKSGSDIERSQLGSRSAVERWMAIQAAVSARALRLTHLARDPQIGSQPAETVLSAEELAGLRTLRASYGDSTPESLTVEKAVERIASLGGYNRQKGRRPGPKTLRLGLERVTLAARVLAELSASKSRRRKQA